MTYLKLHPVSVGEFYKLRHKVGHHILRKYTEKLEIVKKSVLLHHEKHGNVPDESGILNVDVTCDGTWLTRGHKSHIGIVVVIECETGFVLDFEVLSNFCVVCTQLNNKYRKGKITKQTYETRKAAHEAKCTETFSGKSGGMEAQGAKILWERSIEKLNMRYVTFVGDGDSSAYSAVCAISEGSGPYEGVQVEKEECINHVSKRLGTRLRKLKAEDVEVKETKTGKTYKRSVLGGKDKLTDNTISKLTSYYGQAVRRNIGRTVEDLRKDILSTYYHCSSTDENPRHSSCPEGTDSWCFYNRALATGETPPSHNTMKVKFRLDPESRKKILQVYKSLTEEHLLRWCLKGRTQNPNESFHSKIWESLPKVHFFGLKTVQYSVTSTVLHHNFGYEGAELFAEQGEINSRILHRLRVRDKQRINEATRSKPKKRKREEQDVTYTPGGY